jgi:hypothetical protein
MAREPYKTPLGAAKAVHRRMAGTDTYSGIAASPAERLFDHHRVDPERGHFVAVKCANDRVAREAEKILHANGYRGGPGGGSRKTRWVYAYEVTPNTCEKC